MVAAGAAAFGRRRRERRQTCRGDRQVGCCGQRRRLGGFADRSPAHRRCDRRRQTRRCEILPSQKILPTDRAAGRIAPSPEVTTCWPDLRRTPWAATSRRGADELSPDMIAWTLPGSMTTGTRLFEVGQQHHPRGVVAGDEYPADHSTLVHHGLAGFDALTLCPASRIMVLRNGLAGAPDHLRGDAARAPESGTAFSSS